MDSAIAISSINDFTYCPKSLYLHSVYSAFDTSIYHDTPQTLGSITHENIENQNYTTSKHILQGLSVYNAKLGIKGKIDVYDAQNKCLIERKYRVKQAYKGFKYQLYAQMYCLLEAGFKVKKMFLHSLSDNKRYEIPLPTKAEKQEFEKIVSNMKSFSAVSLQKHSCNHCAGNIYSLLDW